MEERKTFIKKLVEEGKSRHEVHGALISEGYTTGGYEDEYAQLRAESGLIESKTEPVSNGSSSLEKSADGALSAPMPSVGALFAFGFSALKKNTKTILIAGVLASIAQLGLSFSPAAAPLALEGSAFTLVKVFFGIASIFLSLLASGSLLYVIIKDDSTIGFLEGIQWTLQRFFSITWLSILTLFITLGGFVLLVIPALVFSVYTIFSYVVLVKEDARGIRALLRSTDLVRGAFWSISLRLSALIIATGLISLVLGLVANMLMASLMLQLVAFIVLAFGQMAIAAFCLGAFVKLYESRAAARPLFDLHAYTVLAWVYRGMAVLGLLVPFIFAAVMGTIFYSVFNTLYSQNIMNDPRLQEEIQWGTPISGTEGVNGMTLADYALQGKVVATGASANVSGGRMGAYDGACADISVIAPVECLDTVESFAVFARMSDGSYYCVDSNEFGGITTRPTTAICP